MTGELDFWGFGKECVKLKTDGGGICRARDRRVGRLCPMLYSRAVKNSRKGQRSRSRRKEARTREVWVTNTKQGVFNRLPWTARVLSKTHRTIRWNQPAKKGRKVIGALLVHLQSSIGTRGARALDHRSGPSGGGLSPSPRASTSICWGPMFMGGDYNGVAFSNPRSGPVPPVGTGGQRKDRG